jgi:hypothetical protein
LKQILEIVQLGLLMANAVLQCGHMMANRDCLGGEKESAIKLRGVSRGMYLPVSSGNKEGLRARIEGVERIEAADEGLGETRGSERESDVECIQSPTWRGSSWEASVDADSGRPSTFFPFTLAWTRTRPLPQSGRLCDERIL